MRKLLLASSALVPLGLSLALANPLGPQVVGGAAAVQGTGTPSVTVIQSSQNAVVNWNTFNIGAGEKTQFVQPNASATILNRVTGDPNPSQILGTLTGNGRVFLINPNGVLIGNSAVINTAGFLATTHDVKNDDFMAGRYNFNIPGRPAASIVNQGTITASNAGFAALVAPGVRNSGTITATFGKIGLASANGFSLDLYGDKLLTLGVKDSIVARVKDVATGQTLNSLVQNAGKLKANGGRIELTAVAARQVVDSVINTTGVIEANSIGNHNGMIVLGATTAANKAADAPTQTVKISGTLLAAGKKNGTRGGSIQVTGEDIVVVGAEADTSGRNGGGKVLIGGDIGGGHVNPLVASRVQAQLETAPIATASTVSIDAASTINASATMSGDGGKVVVWSDQATAFYGSIFARGGMNSGNGGFVETSSHQMLTFNGKVDLGSTNGKKGTLLLDPQNVTIGSAGSSVVTVAALQNALASGDVEVLTDPAVSGGGNITVAESFSWNNSSFLILGAFRNIIVNNGVTIKNTGGGELALTADATRTLGTGAVFFNSTGKIDFSHSTGGVQIYYNPPKGYANPINYSFRVLNNPALPFSNLRFAAMWVNTLNDLNNVRQNLSGAFALSKPIDASTTASWNGGAGFIPIGTAASPFNGFFLGGATIDRLTINSAATDVGLFGHTGSHANIQDANLTNVSVRGASSVGALVGQNDGFIFGSTVTGVVSGSSTANVGGLVGVNTSNIFFSSSTATVNGGGNSVFGGVGGLVGVNSGSVTRSKATGPVNGIGGGLFSGVGGLVGQNLGTTSLSSATGPVVAASNDTYAGGLVGFNTNTVSQSYATGSVASPFASGGLVGGSSSTITESYAAGAVSVGAGGTAGGLLAANLGSGSVVNSYWDSQTTGQVTSDGGNARTTAQLKGGLPPGFDPLIWTIDPSKNSGYPDLQFQPGGGGQPTFTILFGSPPTVSQPQPTADQVLEATLASLTNQSANISKTDTNPVGSEANSMPLPAISKTALASAPTAASSTQTQTALAEAKQPPQWFVDDVKAAYGSSPEGLGNIKIIAQDAQYAQLANAAYANGAFAPQGWKVILGQEALTGMNATVFQNRTTGEVVLSFRGAVTGADWKTNEQLARLSIDDIPEMKSALTFATSVQQTYHNVIFTGHSLGGAMAQYAAIKLGGQAIAFDPAPLAPSLLAAQREDSSARGALTITETGATLPTYQNITNFRGPNDPLTALTGMLDVGRPAVTIRNVRSDPRNPILFPELAKTLLDYNHSMDAIANSMMAVQIVAPSILRLDAKQ